MRSGGRVWAELAGNVLFWGVILAATASAGVWLPLLVLYFVPAYLAGNLQSLRKYVEHMGMTGTTANGLTRSIVPGKCASANLRRRRCSTSRTTGSTTATCSCPASAALHGIARALARAGEVGPYLSYGHALVPMLRCLADPRIGPQWLAQSGEQVLDGVAVNVGQPEVAADLER